MAEIKFDPSLSVVLVKATITGRYSQTVHVALNTGATYTMIPWKIAEALGYAPEVAEDRIHITTASGTEKVPLINVDSFAVSTAKVSNLKVAVHDLPEKSRIDGLLGINFLRSFHLSLDFHEGIIELDKNT